MKTLFLALMFLVTSGGLAAKPLTFTFEEYQIDPATYPKVDPTKYPTGEFYPLKLLADLKPIARQSVEISGEGNGKAVATIGDKTVSIEVRAVPNTESKYRISIKYSYVSAYSGEMPITTTHAGETGGTFKVGDARVVNGLKGGVDGSEEAYVMVVRLTE